MTDLTELLTRKEPLIPELKMFEYEGPVGLAIHHPLIIELFCDPERAALINERYRRKRELIKEASEQGKWLTYVFAHERPYRVGALHHAILNARENKADLPELVGQVWTDSENIQQHKAAWRDIWRGLPDTRKTMNVDETFVFEALPDVVEIYRGIRHATYWPRGMSWTLDEDRALFFASRLPKKGLRFEILTAKIDKKHILAYFNGRREQEIVVFPRHLRDVTTDRNQWRTL